MQKFCVIILLTSLAANGEGFPKSKWSRPIPEAQNEFAREKRQFSLGEWIPLSKPCPTCMPVLNPLEAEQGNEDIGLTPPRPPVTRQIHGERNFFPQDDSAVLSVPPPPPGGIPSLPVPGPNENFQSFPIQNLAGFNGPLPMPTSQSFPPTSQQIQFLPQSPFANNQNLLVDSNRQNFPVVQSVLFGQGDNGGQFVRKEKIPPNFDSNFGQQKFTKNGPSKQTVRPTETNFPTALPDKSTPLAGQETLLQQTIVQQPPVVQQQQAANFEKSILTPPPVPNTTAQNVGFEKEEIQLLYVPVETLRQRGTYQQQQQQQIQKLQSLNQQQLSLNQRQQSLNQQQQSLNQQEQQKAQQQQALNQQNQSVKQQQQSLNQQLQSLKQQQDSLNQQLQQQQSFSQLQQQQIQPVLKQQQQLIDQQQEQKAQQQLLIDQQHQQQTKQQELLNLQKQQQIEQQELLNQRQKQLNTQQKRLQQNIKFQSRPITEPRPSLRPTEPTTTTIQLPKGYFITQNGPSQGQTPSTTKLTSGLPFSPVPTASTLFFQTLPVPQTPHPFVSATPISSTPSPFKTSSTVTQQFFSATPEPPLSHLSTLQNTIPYSQFETTPNTIFTEESLRGEIITGRPQFENFQNQGFKQNFAFLQPQQQGNIQHQSLINHLKQTSDTQPNHNKVLINEQSGTGVEINQLKPQWQDQQPFTLQNQQNQLRFGQQQKEKELREQYLLKELQQKELTEQGLAEQKKQKELEEQILLERQQRQKKLEEQRRKELEEQILLEQKRQKESEEQRFLQFQRQKEADRERILEEQRQKELEEERYLQLQRQRAAEQEQALQEQRQKEIKEIELKRQKEAEEKQRQNELEEQQRLQKLKEIEETRLAIESQGVKEERPLLSWKKQQNKLKNQRLQEEQQQKEFEEQGSFQQEQKEKQLEGRRILQQQRQQQRQNNFEEQNLFRQEQEKKHLEGRRILQQQRQNNFEEQRALQKEQKEKQLEGRRILQQQRQQQRQNNFEEQNSFQHEQNEKQLEGRRILQQQRQQQRQNNFEEQNLFRQEQEKKHLEGRRILQQQRQNNFEEQRALQQEQKEKQLEGRRILQQQRQQQRQNNFEEQNSFQHEQNEKQLEERRILHQQRQQQRQNNLQEQNLFRQEQKEKQLEREKNLQQQLQQQRQNNFEEQISFQQKQVEDQRVLQQQRKEHRQNQFEEQRILAEQQSEEQDLLRQQQLEERQRLWRQQELQRQKEENYKNLQKFYQPPEQSFGQSDEHSLSVTDRSKKAQTETSPLIPHQPPLSVFYKGYGKGKSRITDVLRELRTSKTITVLDQYFEKMPVVFVGPAALSSPTGYDKFDLPYLSNIESNIIHKKISDIPFFVAPLNFVPPSGYSKIPFPSPHVGSVVVSNESNPAMTAKAAETDFGTAVEEDSNDSIVGPELPGLINSLETERTTAKTTTTPSLPQTTAQSRNRRPGNSLFRGRKPVSRTRPTTTSTTTTTSKPEEVNHQSQREEDSEGVVRRPFNRFVKRRRQPVKSTTESTGALNQQPKKEVIQNRHYSVRVNQQSRNSLPAQKQFGDHAEKNYRGDLAFSRTSSGTRNQFRVRPTPEAHNLDQTGSIFTLEEENFKRTDRENDESDNFQSFEDGPLPTGSAKTLTLELYRPNDLSTKENQRLPDDRETALSKSIEPDDSPKSVNKESESMPTEQFVRSGLQNPGETGDSITPATESEQISELTSQKYLDSTEYPKTDGPTPAGDTSYNVALDNAYASAFAEITKSSHFLRAKESTEKYEKNYPREQATLADPSYELEAPFPEYLPSQQQSQEFSGIGVAKPSQALNDLSQTIHYSRGYEPTGPTEYSSDFRKTSKSEQDSDDYSSEEVKPISLVAATNGHSSGGYLAASAESALKSTSEDREQYTTELAGLENYESTTVATENHRDFQPFPRHTEKLTPEYLLTTEKSGSEDHSKEVEESQASITTESIRSDSKEVTEHLSEKTSPQIVEETQRPDDQRQDDDKALTDGHEQKFANARIRTRVRGRQRGQGAFSASQSTTPAPHLKLNAENGHDEDEDQEMSTNSYNQDHPQHAKTSRYNFRVAKKPLRPTTETTPENNQKHQVYTFRPHRRPVTSSTHSTKIIRRPTHSSPTAESFTETYATFQPDVPSDSGEATTKFPASGVSNDVYYEPTSFPPAGQQYRESHGSQDGKINSFQPPKTPSSTANDYGVAGGREELPKAEDPKFPKEGRTGERGYFEVYPQWRSPSESEFDSTGNTVTTFRPQNQAESKDGSVRFQGSEKAFDPDSGKKNGRRRIRVRVHKRPHENFETAESQNLRTVANILVPATSTYKPSEESRFGLDKSSQVSHGDQKGFRLRNENHFDNRFNLTRNVTITQDEVKQSSKKDETGMVESEFDGNSGKVPQRKENEFANSESNEKNYLEIDGRKISRTKFKGYIRKVIRQKIPVRGEEEKEKGEEGEKPNQSAQYVDIKVREGNPESISSSQIGGNREGFNQIRRLNGTRHKTIVRYIKKNKVRVQESQTQKPEDPEDSSRSEESTQAYTTQNLPQTESTPVGSTEEPAFGTDSTKLFPVYQETSEGSVHSTKMDSVHSVFQETSEESVHSTEPSSAKTNQGRLPYKFRSYQTSRPSYQRTAYTEFNRPKVPTPSFTTESQASDQSEKRFRPSKYKSGKIGYHASNSGTAKIEESIINKSSDEQNFERRNKTKSFYGFDARKYSSGRNRESGLSQFSRNRYATSEKPEIPLTATEERLEFETSTTETTGSEYETNPTGQTEEYSTTEVAYKSTREFVETTFSQAKEEESELLTTTEETATLTTESEESSFGDSSSEATTEETSTLTSESEENSFGDSNSSSRETTTTETIESETDSASTYSYTSGFKTTLPAAATNEEPSTMTESTQLPLNSSPETTGTNSYEPETQPDLFFRFGKPGFSFEGAENFAGTQNRAYVRNITADIIESTSSFSAPGIENRQEAGVSPVILGGESLPKTTEATAATDYEKTTTETMSSETETTTEPFPETDSTASTLPAATSPAGKGKISKIPVKTSTATKVSHETEICYRGKCIRTKSENPVEEELKLLVNSASVSGLEKNKT